MKSLYSVKVRDEYAAKGYSYEYYKAKNLEWLAVVLSFSYFQFEILQVKIIKRIPNKIYKIKEI